MCIDLIMHKAYLNKSLNHPTSARVWKKKKIKDIRPQRKYIHTPKHNLYLRLHARMRVCVCEGEERCTHLFKDWTTDLSTKLVDVDMI